MCSEMEEIFLSLLVLTTVYYIRPVYIISFNIYINMLRK